jgi:hypothetical protein
MTSDRYLGRCADDPSGLGTDAQWTLSLVPEQLHRAPLSTTLCATSYLLNRVMLVCHGPTVLLSIVLPSAVQCSMADSESHVLAMEPGFTRKNLSIWSLFLSQRRHE